MTGYLGGKSLRLDPSKSIGKGGEADIYDLGNGLAAKIFKPPSHPDFTGQPLDQKAAEARISEHQRKLRMFPQNLPQEVICPKDLVTDKSGNKILGYTMEYLSAAELLYRYAQIDFRQAGVANQEVVEIFLRLHQVVENIHKSQVTIGDFNDLNVLVKDGKVWIIDADSFDFGSFRCRVFTQRFVDPLLCDPKAKNLSLVKPYNSYSDWYAFAVMLMQSLLFVDPYGGVYRPKDTRNRLPHDQRPLKRVTVFHPEVRYPKPATPFCVLPDDLLHYLNQTFVRDLRSEFPVRLLQELRWTKCENCRTEHARNLCPVCKHQTASVKEVVKVYEKVIVSRVFKTHGLILHSKFQNGRLVWLYHEGNAFKRETQEVLIQGSLERSMRYRICGKAVIFGKANRLASVVSGQTQKILSCDSVESLPIFDTTSKKLFWIENGRLLRDDELAPGFIGDVLAGQTLFWTGENLGFGFYRAGSLCVAFLFDPQRKGINDNVKLPTLSGQVVDAYCLFSQNRVWFLVATRHVGKAINHCMVINSKGIIEATASADAGSPGWLSTLRGKCVAGNMLFAPTDDGIVRVECNNGQLAVVQEFVETEPFVDSNCQLHIGNDGMYAVYAKEILHLKMKG